MSPSQRLDFTTLRRRWAGGVGRLLASGGCWLRVRCGGRGRPIRHGCGGSPRLGPRTHWFSKVGVGGRV